MGDEIAREKVVEWLNTQWKGNKVCPICKNNAWTVSEKPAEVREFHGGSLVVGGSGSVYPLFLVTCNKCGYTVLFNAIVAGFVPPREGK